MSRATKWIERCLWAVGLLALGTCGYVWLDARHKQAEGSQELDRRIHAQTVTKSGPAPGDLVGRLEISRLGMSAIVFEGTDEPVLQRGVGHMAGSPLPGDKGNVVLAGHRDTFFRALRNVHEGDLITMTTETGTRRYAVESTSVVDPDQTAALDPTLSSTLTLVTCYPFRYIGNAPQRFIVRSREVSEVAQAPVEPPRKKPVARRRKPVVHSQIEPVALNEPADDPPRTHKKFNPFRFLKKLKF